jgi:hypothetical protein
VAARGRDDKVPRALSLSDPFAAFEAASRRGEARARGSRQRRVTRLRLPRPTGRGTLPGRPVGQGLTGGGVPKLREAGAGGWAPSKD